MKEQFCLTQTGTGCHASGKDGIFSTSIGIHISLISTYVKEMEIELYVSQVLTKSLPRTCSKVS